MQSMKPGQPGNNQGRGFVICEVCDGYIKDMEQLRNHMQWIHKVCSNSISIVLSINLLFNHKFRYINVIYLTHIG